MLTTQVTRASRQSLVQGRSVGTSAIDDYLSKMRPDTTKKSSVQAPQFIVGKSGAQAMKIWEKVFSKQGDAGLVRAEKEFDVFVWTTREGDLWPLLTQTPDEIIPRDRKVAVLRKQLQEIGCSEEFSEVIVELFNTADISALEQIRHDFLEINRAHRREVDVVLVTPSSLNEEQLAFYKNSIALNFLKEGDNMIFSHSVDSSLEAGYKVSVKGVVHDYSHHVAKENYFQTRKNKAEAELRSAAGIFSRFRINLDSIFSEAQKKDLKELGISFAKE